MDDTTDENGFRTIPVDKRGTLDEIDERLGSLYSLTAREEAVFYGGLALVVIAIAAAIILI